MSFPTTGVSFDSRYKPTSSHVSAPSKLPMVTSNSDFVSLLHHAVFPLKSIDFFALMMMFVSSSVILSYWEANTSACVKRSSDMDGINAKTVTATNLNQWKNTNAVLTWFKNVPNKQAQSFISFDIVDFYPSISEDLLTQALVFASQYDNITDEEKNIIIKAKKSILFDGNTAWCKRETKSLFDVTMGSFDGAETCELVGLYLLSKLTPVVGNDIGLYRDDGLAALNKTPREIENIKKYICQTFNEHNLKLTIEANKKTVNFLDVTLDLNSSTYKPYTKPGNVIQYVNRESNHPRRHQSSEAYPKP